VPEVSAEAESIHALASAAATLTANERDLSAWWRIAMAFEELGEKKLAVSALDDLGRAASELGVVALAMACVVRLRELGSEKESSGLLDRVSATHCLGSKRVGESQNFAPPDPPTIPPPGSLTLPEGLKAAKKEAASAIKNADKAARSRAPKVLPPTPLVRYLSADDMKSLVSVMTMRNYKRGEVIVDLGDDADALFWVARGSAEVSRDGRLLGELRSDSFFGEIALVGATTRTARVACLEDTYVLAIPASAVGELAVKAPNLAKVLATHARSRLLSNVTRTSEIFRRLSVEEKRSLLPRFETRFAEEGEFLIKTGTQNDSLFVLVSGGCEVRADDEVLTTLTVGDGFGEMSMLGRKPATCDVVAVSAVVLLRVSREMFDEIAMAHPELLSEVYKLLVERERENDAIIHDAEDLVI
jgi:CRP-like cAMP-binding protein